MSTASSSYPRVAMSPNAFPAEDRHFYKHKALEYGEMNMASCVRQAGGFPFLAYRAGVETPEEMASYAEVVIAQSAALLLTGGTDICPSEYGETLANEAWRGDPVRDKWELSLYAAARRKGIPVLGVCRGMQLMNVAHGGSLWQDLVTMRPDTQVHRSQELYCQLEHGLEVTPKSRLEGLLGEPPFRVNSVHHQGVRELGAQLRAVAWAPDGVIEAFEVEDNEGSLGVQWHPEWMMDDARQRMLFNALIDHARRVM